jgi:hypothetical protein
MFFKAVQINVYGHHHDLRHRDRHHLGYVHRLGSLICLHLDSGSTNSVMSVFLID